MNFKESYKKANDEIKGDRALLEKILNEPAKEKTKIAPMVYRFASCAAAIILVGAVILMPEIKEKFVSENENAVAGESVEEAKYSIPEDTAEATEETVDGHTSDKADDTEKIITFKAARKEENAKEVSESETYATGTVTMDEVSEDTQGADAVNESAVVFSLEEADTETMTVAESYDTAKEAAPKTKIASGGGSSAAATRNMNARVETKTTAEEKSASEIIGLIGINEESLVPSGMTLTSSEVTLSEFSPEGNITAYEINMVYEKDGAKLILRLTDSATPLALDVAGHSGMVSASETFNGTDFFVTAYNLTEEEVTNYLNGIK